MKEKNKRIHSGAVRVSRISDYLKLNESITKKISSKTSSDIKVDADDMVVKIYRDMRSFASDFIKAYNQEDCEDLWSARNYLSNYEDYKCPVCNKQFTKDDDIVTCPECGTPHHRECYNLTGHCVNKGLHASGYSFLDEHKPIIPEAPKQHNANTGEYYAPPADGNSNATNQNQGENQPTQMPFPTIQTIQFDIPEYKEQGEIDGVNINDIAATIRTNPQRFIEKFKGFSAKKSKISWNWGAFFFGSYYLLFRKMYKQGVAFFCILFSIVLVGDAALF